MSYQEEQAKREASDIKNAVYGPWMPHVTDHEPHTPDRTMNIEVIYNDRHNFIGRVEEFQSEWHRGIITHYRHVNMAAARIRGYEIGKEALEKEERARNE